MIGNFFLFNACIEEELYYKKNDSRWLDSPDVPPRRGSLLAILRSKARIKTLRTCCIEEELYYI